MDIDALKATAQDLRAKLEHYKLKEPAASLLLTDLEGLLRDAERGLIHAPVEPRDIPGYRLFAETDLQSYRDLSEAYSNFYVELIDARQSEAYKLLAAKMKNH